MKQIASLDTGELLERHGAGGDGEEKEDDRKRDDFAAIGDGGKHTVSGLREGIQQCRPRTGQLSHQDQH